MFDHYVITRFNLKLENHFKNDKNGNPTQTEEWLKRRFELFELYCFPSLKAQSCQDFIWLVLFDSNTPSFYKPKIDFYHRTYNNFIPVFLDTGEPTYLQQSLSGLIISHSDKNTPYIITTRIDSDDAFHNDMIKEVQSFFTSHEDDCFLNFNYGIQYDTDKCIAIKIKYENNHFLSRLERNNTDLETVIIHDHTQIQSISNVISVGNKKKPMWMEVIHELNISNYLHLFKPVFSENSLSGFNLNLAVDKCNTYSHVLKFGKKSAYGFLSQFFTRLGLYNQFKRIIRLCKLPTSRL